ncbi:MAG: tetratricopeptide repeat protein [Bacteroidales bacterium]|nr:tetratricopeptide repeat protein [Bacteroidales bacterium]
MSKKKNTKKADNFQDVENALTKTEQYIEENQKTLSTIVLILIVVVAGYFAYLKFYVKPLEEEAASQMFVAEQYFEKDSFNLAINGDGNYLGFIDIIDEYGVTKSANLAQYYAGISYLKLGQYEEAIDYLKDFDSDDHIIAPIALGSIGDAYSELGDNDEAISYYLKAAKTNSNKFTTPMYLMKAAKAYEANDDYQNSLDIYNDIKNNYPKDKNARFIEKYITRAELNIEK